MKRFFWCFVVMTNLCWTHGAELPRETQSFSFHSTMLTKSVGQTIPLVREIYQHRNILMSASLACILVASLPTANAVEPTSPAYPGVDCRTMKPTMVLCEYGYSGGDRLHDICQYGCDAYAGPLNALASGMVNMCCDYYGYFFDYY